MGLTSLRSKHRKAWGLATLAAVGATVSCLEIDRRRVSVDPGGAGGTTMTGGKGGTGGSTGGASGTGGSGGSTGGTESGGSGGTQGGTSGSAGADDGCDNPKDELTIDGSHWIPRECNDYGIQGAWYCYSDGISDTDCEDQPRYDEELGAYCMSGTTIVDQSLKAWGVGMGFELNSDEVGKDIYDCEAHDITGFAITMQGISGTPVRVNFTDTASGSDPSPFVELEPFGNETRTFDVLIADAEVPDSWPDATAGKQADPKKIMDVQIQVVGASDEEPFELCVTHVKPILADAK